jgi:hypothetical protein
VSLSLLFWITVVIALISFWWQSDQVKHIALTHVYRYCKTQNLQLLDQSMVLRGVWPARDEQGSLKLRRRYSFEFTSTGEARYQGTVELFGNRLQKLELEAHIFPEHSPTNTDHL